MSKPSAETEHWSRAFSAHPPDEKRLATVIGTFEKIEGQAQYPPYGKLNS